MEQATTLVIGASTNPTRYSYLAINRLRSHKHPVIAFSQRSGTVSDVNFETEWNESWKVDTVTLYINPDRQSEYIEKIIGMKPRRVIFNPGTENPAFIRALNDHGIATETACTLVMLAVGQY